MEELAVHVKSMRKLRFETKANGTWKGGDRNFVFHSGTGKPYYHTTAPQQWKNWCERHSFRNVSLHDLRHTNATYCWAREHLSRRFNIDYDIPHLRCLQIPMLTSPRSLVVKQQHTSMSSIQKFVPNPSPGAKKALAPCDPVIWKPGFQSLKNKKSLDNQGIQKKNNSAEDRDRTGTVVTYRRILSPVRLPIPPPRHNLRNAILHLLVLVLQVSEKLTY